MPRVFVSYRRGDSEDVTGRIYEHLVSALGDGTVFKDVDSIPLGSDFRKVIAKAIRQCDTVLAIIGPNWTNVRTSDGSPRLHDADDFVRLELETAMENGIQIIPLLVGGATLPSAEVVPVSLKELPFLNAATVRHDPDFKADIERIVDNIQSGKVERLNADRQEHRDNDRRGIDLRLDMPNYSLKLSSGNIGCLVAAMLTLALLWFLNTSWTEVRAWCETLLENFVD